MAVGLGRTITVGLLDITRYSIPTLILSPSTRYSVSSKVDPSSLRTIQSNVAINRNGTSRNSSVAPSVALLCGGMGRAVLLT